MTPDWNEMKEPATTLPPMANENYAAFVEFEEENAGFERREALPEPRHVTTVFSARKKKGEATGATSDDERVETDEAMIREAVRVARQDP